MRARRAVGVVLSAAAGCGPGGGAVDTGAPPVGRAVVLATVASDYQSGALAVVDRDTLQVQDGLATISGDPVVTVAGPWVVQINRYGVDTVRLYDPGAWEAPELEFSTGDLSNPYDAALCGDELAVARFGTADLPFYDPATGLQTGAVDLSSLADADGLPEPTSLVPLSGNRLLVGLARVDRDGGWVSEAGAVAEVDCASRSILRSWEVGPSADVHPWPGRDDAAWVRTGQYLDAQGQPALSDGALALWAGDAPATVLTEPDLGGNLTDAAGARDGGVALLVADADDRFAVACLGPDGQLSMTDAVDLYLSDVAVDEAGRAWVAARPGWSAPDQEGGTLVVDFATCTWIVPPPGLQTVLDPFALAVVP